MTEQDLTPAEICAALVTLKAQIGDNAYLSVTVSLSDSAFSKPSMYGSVYPTGLCGGGQMRVESDTWRGLVAEMTSKWEEARHTYENETMRRMALAIIETTYALGECSDNALRGQKFSADEVKRFSAAACELASTMADRGPFTVLTLDNSNEAA